MFNVRGLLVTMRLSVRRLVAVMVVAASMTVQAQDTRTVVEPTFPMTCTALAAQQAIVGGEPVSENALDTVRIQTALSACAAGQAVELTLGGTNNGFLSGPLNIPSGVTLIVDGGVTLFGSRNPTDYQSTVGGAETCGTVGSVGNGCVPLIQINNGSASAGAGVMGYGVINGRGGDKLLKGGVAQTYSWWDLASQANGNGVQNNPILLYAKNAANFTLYKITLTNSPMFHVKYQTASGFTVWGVKILSPYNARNTDGIDPDDRITNVTINNSYISDGDDDVAIGASGASNGVSNVTISNTHTYSGHGVSIGSITSGGVSNVLVQNVAMSGNLSDGNSVGLRIKSADDRGGVVNNIQYRNVCIQNIRVPFQFNPFYNTNLGTSIPSYQNIGLHNVTASTITGSTVQLQGFSANFPLGITFDNLNVSGGFNLTPVPRFANITIGPGPVTPASLQTISPSNNGSVGITYTGSVTNPTQAPFACPTTAFPFLSGELYLSTSTLNNQKSLALPNPASFTLNAIVEITEASKPAPTSAIEFYEGTNLVGSATLSGNGTLASLTLTGVTSGVHTYTAVYPQDANFTALSFGAVTVNVNTTGTVTTMTATPTVAVYGSSVKLTATVVQSVGTVVPTGSVTFMSGTSVLGSVPLNVQGVAVLNTAALPVGSDSVAAFYAGGSGFGASDSSSAAVIVNVVQAGTSMTVGAAPANTTYGGSVILTAAVVPVTSGVPSGTITFMDGATTLGTATLGANIVPSQSVAQLTINALGAGFHSISASYGGDINYVATASTSNAPETVAQAATTTAVSFSSNNVPYGTAITMTANVTGVPISTPAGSVTFVDTSVVPANTLAVVPIPFGTGSASYTTQTLIVGTHTIQAFYSGDPNYLTSNSIVKSLVIVKAQTSVTIGATKASIVYGSSDTFSVTVSPATSGVPSGTAKFLDGSTTLGTATLFGGAGSFTASALSGGTHWITVAYGGDSNFQSGTSSPLLVTVSPAPTTTAMSAPASITYGSTAVFSATVNSSIAGTLTGIVTFMDGGTFLGSGALTGGAAIFSAPVLSGGAHTITAVYSGDPNYAASSSASSTLTVTKASTTASVIATSPVITFGGSETLVASVLPAGATGTFTFLDGGAMIGTGAISGGSASLTLATLATGTHLITAIYSGDGNYTTSAATAVTVQVNQAASTTGLVANPTTLVYLASTTLTATVSASGTGSVTFKDGANTIGTGTTINGIATFTTATLVGGLHNITAVYGGNTNYLGSTSGVVVVTVQPAVSTTSVLANPATIVYGGSTVLTATLGNATGTGTITLKDGVTTLGTGTVSAGAASYMAVSLAGGTHSISAVYSGDSNFVASTSAAITVVVTQASTTTSLIATPTSVTFGGSTVLRATVSNASATGSVTFKDGGTTVGSAVISGGVASYTAASLLGGLHNITAVYSGDTNFATSTSAISVVTVITLGTTTSVVATPAAATFGGLVTLTASVLPTGGTPAESGAVTFLDGLMIIGTGTVTNGFASVNLATLSTGVHSITASYGGDGNYAASVSASFTVTINQIVSTVSLVANPGSVTFGGATTLTATVVPATATGTVTFVDSVSGTVGTGTLSGGVASISLSTLAVGTHSVTAVYGGDTNDAAATSVAIPVSVGLITTATTFAAQPSAINVGGVTILTATVSPVNVTGTVTFRDGGAILGTANISAGSASLSVSTLKVGTHNITATYSGDNNNGTSTSAGVVVTVSTIPTTTLISAPATVSFGSTALITVTVAPAAATGTVTFKDGIVTLGTSVVSGGVATFTASLAVGSHPVSASYSGDATYAASTSVASTVTVLGVSTTTTLGISAGSVIGGGSVTLTGTVASAAGAPGTGTVTFLNGTATLGTAAVTNGVATFTLTNLTVGAYSITASFGASGNYAGSVSSAALLTVVAPVTLSLSPASLSLAAGQSGTSTLTVMPGGGFTGTVALGCSSPVAYVTCTVTSPVTISGTTVGTAIVSINVAATYGSLRIPEIGPERGPSVAVLASVLPFGALLLLPLVWRRRRVGLRLIAVLVAAAGMSLVVTGCAGSGGITPHLPPAGSQTVTITATANGAVVSTGLTVVVTN